VGLITEAQLTFGGGALTINGDVIKSSGIDIGGGTFTIDGNLLQTGGTMNINGGTLNVSGNYRIQSRSVDSHGAVTYGNSSGGLRMSQSSDRVIVSGDFFMQSSATPTYSSNVFSAGIMEIGGNFTQLNGNASNFNASGLHRIIFNGTGQQNISFASTSSGFNSLVISNRTGPITFTARTNVRERISQPGGADVQNRPNVFLNNRLAFEDKGSLNVDINRHVNNALNVIPTWRDYEAFRSGTPLNCGRCDTNPCSCPDKPDPCSCGICVICDPCVSCGGICGQVCTHPNCSRTVPACGVCATCKDERCVCDKADCGICNEGGKWFALGDVDGNDAVNIFDALEILKFIIGMNSTISHGNIQDGALRAARISPTALTEGGKPNIFCALEILKFIIGMTSEVDGIHISGKPT
jgi:hypothetical protein